MKYFILITGILLFAQQALASAYDPQLTEAYGYYKKGNYPQAIRVSQSIADPDDPAGVAFFQGTVYSKMQEFLLAAEAFKFAEQKNCQEKSIHYDRGQALYAAQKLEEARDEFLLSAKQNYKKGASYYYVAFVFQTLEDFDSAKKYYGKIAALSDDADHVKQPSLFQVGEILYQENEKVQDADLKRLHLLDTVLPAYERAANFEAGTETSITAEGRITEVDQKIDAALPRMINGVPLPRRAYTLNFSEALEYNTNVTYQADSSVLQVSNKDALGDTLTMLARYQWNLAGRWSILPEVYLSATYYSRTNTPAVYQNDNVNILPALRTRYEHTVSQHPASLLLEVEYDYMLRDYQQLHRLPYYSRYWNYVLGERAKFFDMGATTIKLGLKLAENEDPSRNDINPSISLDQVVRVWGKYDLDNTVTYDYVRSRNSYYDERNYTLKESMAMPKLLGKTDFTPSLSLAAKDTMNQQYFRGIELNVNPSITFSRELGKKWSLDFTYSFIRYLSKSVDQYEYTQHDAKFTLNCHL